MFDPLAEVAFHGLGGIDSVDNDGINIIVEQVKTGEGPSGLLNNYFFRSGYQADAERFFV